MKYNKKIEVPLIDRKTLFPSHVFNKGFVFRIYKNSQNSTVREKIQFKNGQTV